MLRRAERSIQPPETTTKELMSLSRTVRARVTVRADNARECR